jgi:hypothetical protein
LADEDLSIQLQVILGGAVLQIREYLIRGFEINESEGKVTKDYQRETKKDRSTRNNNNPNHP